MITIIIRISMGVTDALVYDRANVERQGVLYVRFAKDMIQYSTLSFEQWALWSEGDILLKAQTSTRRYVSDRGKFIGGVVN